MIRIIYLLSFALLAGPAPLKANERSMALQAVLEQAREQLDVPGLSATIIFSDGKQWTGTTGKASEERLVSAELAFETGSITKLYTAATMLRLVDQGLLELDQNLEQWLPDFPGAGQITVRQLLQHTSGLYNIHDDPEFMPQLFMDPGRHWTAQEILSRLREPYFAPGEGWHYSNTNYILIGLVIERVSQDSVAKVMRRELFEPLGLRQTWFAAEEKIDGPRAHAYLDITGDDVPDDITAMMPDTAFLSTAWTAGAVVASSADVARFVHALFSGELLKQDSQRALLDFIERPDGKQYGLGVLREASNNRVVIGHRGNSVGFSGVTWHEPAAGVTMAILSNGHGVMIQPTDQSLLSMVATGTVVSSIEPNAHVVSARAALQRESFEEVIAALEPQIETEPDNPEALILLSRAYISTLSARSPVRTYHRSKRLVSYLERAIELDPVNHKPYWLLLNFYLQAPAIVGGDKDRAFEYAKSLMTVDKAWGYRGMERYYRHTRQLELADRYAKLLSELEDVSYSGGKQH